MVCRAIAVALLLGACASRVANDATELVVEGESKTLRDRDGRAPSSTRPDLLVLALDGVPRELLYEMLRAGELPGLAALLGGRRGDAFPHAVLADDVLTVLPSSTMPAWASAFTGKPPAAHGVAGNEYFVRAERRFAAPVPTSFQDVGPALAALADGSVNDELRVPTVYQRLRAREPEIRIWVSMSPIHAGADRLLLVERGLLFDALDEAVGAIGDGELVRGLWDDLDASAIATVVDALGEDEPPDVLTIYLAGTDYLAHTAPDGAPLAAVRRHLAEVVDPMLRRLHARLTARGALADRWVVVLADHGQTETVPDDRHSLDGSGRDEPPAVLKRAGFRVRPARLEVDRDADHQAVLAYQAGMAYVYLADRSTCARRGTTCDWARPPRRREDVLMAAEAFHRADRTGAGVPALRGSLAAILVRRPAGAPGDPFDVYVGGGRVVSLETYLERRPQPAWVAVAPRLRDLATGPHGDRAGDLILIPRHSPDVPRRARTYFTRPYATSHGSPSELDSAIPFIVAHPRRSAREIARITGEVLGDAPSIARLTPLLARLRRVR